ncbi:hypothetical protein [Aureliella helgolandensis]|uniref:Uncharacterized protein n=1 Tax=Aureliella helgolandensis TaxID=2527968 RepID=A0A518G8L0_9BACT|nr:hypothetical protein [Aureliella helgolandensis]QDV24925.1 hypothetical protein Q31a_32470 [Aureliella helgolandensis]|tara:strand:- start:280 stop:789 length:510 start_codon:yes stop_codon:yes gene_type:complete
MPDPIQLEEKQFGQWVEVVFDCMPLRTVPRVDIPIDASPKLAEKMLRVKRAIEKHGTLNSYYLHNATCTFHLTNDPQQGMMQYSFEGVVLTDQTDLKPISCDFKIELLKETCSWLNQAIVDWLAETVQRSVLVEFERYIRAGDLTKAIERLEKLQQAEEESGGFVGMYL